MDNKKAGKLYIFFVALAVVCFAAMVIIAVKNISETNRIVGELSSRAAALATPSPVPPSLPPEIFETPAPEVKTDPVPAESENGTEEEPAEEIPAAQPDAYVYIDGTKTGVFCAGENRELYIPLDVFAELNGSEYILEGQVGSFEFMGKTLAAEADSCVIGIDGGTAELSAPALIKDGMLCLPVDETCAALGYGILHDENNGISYYTYAAGRRNIPEGVNVKVLMYWSIGESMFTGDPELHVKPADFAAQIEYLYYNNYSFITFEDLDRADSFENPVMLTFNNGYEDFYTEVYPVLQQYGIKATVFVITDNIGTGRCLTAQQLREMSASGLVSVQSQTANGLYQKYVADIRTNYAHSRLVITEITGIEPIALCYPKGIVSNDAFLELSNYYRYGVAGMGAPVFVTGSDPRSIYRIFVSGGDSLESFITKLG